MTDEAAIKTLLHNIVAQLIEALYLPGVHQSDYVRQASDSLHTKIDLATLIFSTED